MVANARVAVEVVDAVARLRQQNHVARVVNNDRETASVMKNLADSLAQQRATFLAFAARRMSSSEAEDVVQQALAQAADKMHQLRNPDALMPWFYRILRRVIASHLAAKAKQTQQVAHLKQLVEDSNAQPEEISGCACVFGLLDTLAESYRDVVYLVDVEDLDLQEASRRLGLGKNNTAVRLSRGRRALRKRLAEHCNAHTFRETIDCDCEK